MLFEILIQTGVAGAIAAAVSWIIVVNGKKMGIVDDPAVHKHPKVVHQQAVPRGGGLVIWAAVVVTMLLFVPVDQKVAGVLVGVTILAIVGWIDDKWEEKLSPYLRLGLNVLVAGIVIWAGVRIGFVTNPFGGVVDLSWWVADIFALVWLVSMQNIVGWSSGVDGQMPGFVIIAAVTIAALGWRFNADARQLPVIALAAITAGAYAGFLVWNWYPQKIMPGYGGKSLAGFLMGVLAIMSGAKVGALAMVLGIPFIDAVVVVIKRIREGRSPVWGGYEHLHHLLLDRGWGKRKIALFYWGFSGILGVLALQLNSAAKWFTMASIILVAGGGIWWLHYFSTFSKRPGPDSG
ncbi:MAG: Uncharacterized protein G01um101416_982 [Microgenomates group bacterium Gr01-1014_16]|nr:MAG: Uncharacterized protein G01um101416_982 [Microgenomates group bacterium Gr01-1014_16]